MKKTIPVALIALLVSTYIAAVAGPVHDHAQPLDMQASRDEMLKKMASAKTDEERQQLMTEQQKKMQGTHDMRGNMHAQMGGHQYGDMKHMPANSPEMQKRRQLMQEQMSK
jgi:hypothetical protein